MSNSYTSHPTDIQSQVDQQLFFQQQQYFLQQEQFRQEQYNQQQQQPAEDDEDHEMQLDTSEEPEQLQPQPEQTQPQPQSQRVPNPDAQRNLEFQRSLLARKLADKCVGELSYRSSFPSSSSSSSSLSSSSFSSSTSASSSSLSPAFPFPSSSSSSSSSGLEFRFPGMGTVSGLVDPFWVGRSGRVRTGGQTGSDVGRGRGCGAAVAVGANVGRKRRETVTEGRAVLAEVVLVEGDGYNRTNPPIAQSPTDKMMSPCSRKLAEQRSKAAAKKIKPLHLTKHHLSKLSSSTTPGSPPSGPRNVKENENANANAQAAVTSSIAMKERRGLFGATGGDRDLF